jgi:AraC family transcriptional regulator of arabinose operon
MKGYILNFTIRGEGVINNHGKQYVCRPGDMILFPPGEIHHYGRHPDAKEWYHQWVYFRPRAYWHEWLSWPTIFAQTGFFRPEEPWLAQFSELFGQIIDAGQSGGRYAELLAINLLEQLLLRRMDAINESLHPPLDNRVRDACQYISDHLADNHFDIASVAQHVCLSPSVSRTCSVSNWGERAELARGSAYQSGEAAVEHYAYADRQRGAQCRL